MDIAFNSDIIKLGEGFANLRERRIHLGDARYDHGKNEPVSVSEWIITTIVMAIPLVNIVMPFVWAFGGGTKTSKANFFKAQIVLVLIGLLLYFLVGGMLFSYIRMPSQSIF